MILHDADPTFLHRGDVYHVQTDEILSSNHRDALFPFYHPLYEFNYLLREAVREAMVVAVHEVCNLHAYR